MAGTRGVVAWVLLCAVLAGCRPGFPEGKQAQPTRSPATAAPTAGTPSPAAVAAGPFAGLPVDDVAADLEQLGDGVERIHPEGLHDGADLPTTAAAVGARDPSEVLVATMAALAGRPRDGHTGVFPTAQEDLRMWPLQLYDFDDGWRVVAADETHAHLVGREVTGIGGRSIAEVTELVAPLVPHDNAASRRGRLPLYLVVPAVLAGLGVAPTLQLDGEVVTPTTVPADEYGDRFGLFSPLVCPPLPRPGAPAWAVEDHPNAVVLRYRQVVFTSDDMTAGELAAHLTDRLATTGAGRLVLDLRDNPGGELPAAEPLVAVARSFAAEHPGGLRLLAGRCTFSAAALTVAELLTTTDARLVGEPVGGAPGIWADPRTVTLPRTGLVAHVGRRWYAPADPGLPVQLAPDVTVPVRWLDHHEGRDPALAAAVADERPVS